MTIRIMLYGEPLADARMVRGRLRVRPTRGNAWVRRMIEDMRGDHTDAELYASLVDRLRGRIWAGHLGGPAGS